MAFPLLGCWAGATRPFGQKPAWFRQRFIIPPCGNVFISEDQQIPPRSALLLGSAVVFSLLLFMFCFLIMIIISAVERGILHMNEKTCVDCRKTISSRG